ncbi:unnamed protein product, partial [Rhizoctonia solani]
NPHGFDPLTLPCQRVPLLPTPPLYCIASESPYGHDCKLVKGRPVTRIRAQPVSPFARRGRGCSRCTIARMIALVEGVQSSYCTYKTDPSRLLKLRRGFRTGTRATCLVKCTFFYSSFADLRTRALNEHTSPRPGPFAAGQLC